MITQNLLYFLLILNFICGTYSFVSSQKHLLNTLLSLECIMLSVYTMMSVVLSGMGMESFFVLFFISLAACEGALGLALLVSVVRMCGNEGFKGFNFLQC